MKVDGGAEGKRVRFTLRDGRLVGETGLRKMLMQLAD